MKAGKKLLSIALVLVLALSLGIPAFAAGKPLDYDYYFNIGDSIARGCGLDPVPGQPTYYKDNWNNGIGSNNISGGYPLAVASALGKDKPDANLQYMGIRTVETYYALGGSVDPWSYDNYADDDFGYHITGSIDPLRADFQEAAGKADLITLEIGMNDVFYGPASRAGLSPSSLSTDDLLDTLGNMVQYMWEGYYSFLTYYPQIIDRILSLQKAAKGTTDDVTIMLVGYFNPSAVSALSEDIFLPVGDALTLITASMNAELRSLASLYKQAVYVDVSATQTPISSGDLPVIEGFMSDSTINTHPTPEGYKYMGRQIVNALPAREKPHYPSTYVQVNLGTDFKVDKVYLDSCPASFKQDGYNLVVTNRSILCCTLTVTGTDAQGKTLVYVYALDYSLWKSAYSTYRLTSTNDLTRTLSRVFSGARTLKTTIASAIESASK